MQQRMAGLCYQTVAVVGNWSSIPLCSSGSPYSIKHVSELSQQKDKEDGWRKLLTRTLQACPACGPPTAKAKPQRDAGICTHLTIV